MGRRNLQGRHVILTGASRGIGRALALKFAKFQTHLLLVARNEEKLVELAQECASLGATDTHVLAGDITDPDFRNHIAEHATNTWNCIDLLINNAGVSAHGRFMENDEPTLRTIMEVNFFAATEMTRLAIPLLSKSKESCIVNIGSILGLRGLPHNSEYSASKYALRGWSKAIRPEINKLSIDLLMVSPGTVETEFFEHLLSKSDSIPWGKQKGIAPEAVADQIITALEKKKTEIFPNWRGRLLVLTNRLFPGMVDRFMQRYG